MLRIGLTGGIGSGKTIIAEIFQKLGIPVFNADAEAATITKEPEILSALVKLLGNKIIGTDGLLNRSVMRDIIFHDQVSREKVNHLIHPLVRKKFRQWCELQSSVPFIIEEAAILFESGASVGLDKVIVVSAREKIRLDRVMKRDGVGEQVVKKIMDSQMNESEKKAKADFIIFNDEEHLVIPQVISIYKKLEQLAIEKNK
jgi:dephospho-CoA kinase